MITLYSAHTPNGLKASIMLEEVGLPYKLHTLNLSNMDQKAESFLRINPNGRIPAIVDHDNGDFAVFESGAILVYLAEKTGKLWPTDLKQRSVVMQWLMFQMGGIGPMQGQAGVFLRYAPEKIPFAIERYQKETLRLYTVLDKRLATVPYLAGEYSIADIATFPWVSMHDWVGVDISALKNVQAWLERVGERPAVKRGLIVPPAPQTTPEEAALEVRKMLGK